MKRQFIAASKEYCTREKHLNAPILRKEFSIERPIGSAILEIAAVGFYRAFLNGQEITKGYLAPYISNPNDLVYYDEYDVQGLLQRENVLCLLLGNGFANAMDCGVWDFEIAETRSAPKVFARLTCDGAEVLTTDESFEAFESPITFDDLRCGERYDARLERPELFAPSHVKGKKALLADTPKGEYRKCNAEPIKEEYRIKPKRIFAAENGYIFDFGEINAGIYRLKIDGKSGQKLSFDFGEMVVNGKLDTRNLHFKQTEKGYIQHDEYICREGLQEWSPSFTYHGYQYAYVEGLTEEQATEDLLEYIVMHSDVKQRGHFSCSNAVVNQIFDCTLRSDKSNLFYIPTDCPHREKNGWTADASLSAEQFLYNLDCVETLREWLRNVCKAQKESGMLPGIVPTTGWGFQWGNGPAWDSVIVEIPYQSYRFTGNQEIIQENILAMIRYFDFISEKLKDGGLAKFGLGDWCEAETATGGSYTTPLEYTNLLTLVDMANKTLAMLANLDDAQANIQKIKGYRKAFLQEFRERYIVGKELSCKTQTAFAMAISVDGVLTEEESKLAGQELISSLQARGNRFKVGVIGAKHLFDALTKIGETDRAIAVIVNPEYPSFGYWMKTGATTLWENFIKLSEGGELQGEDGTALTSLNHHFWGTVVGWFYRVIGGLNILSHNQAEIKIPATQLLDYAKCTWQDKDRRIAVEWKKKDGNMLVEIENSGFEGGVYLSAQRTEKLRAGKQTYTVEAIR